MKKQRLLIIYIDGKDLSFSAIEEAIISLGGSVHSIDEVEVSAVNTTEV